MNIRQLEYVLAIARYKNMRAAASHCDVSEATVSVQVRALEAELQLHLFDRANNCLWLTDECRKILPVFQRVIDAREAVLHSAHELRKHQAYAQQLSS